MNLQPSPEILARREDIQRDPERKGAVRRLARAGVSYVARTSRISGSRQKQGKGKKGPSSLQRSVDWGDIEPSEL